MLLDIAISAALFVIASGMGYLGVRVTLTPAETPKQKRWYRRAFLSLTVCAAGLIVWQGVRNGRAQQEAAATISMMNQKVNAVENVMATATHRPTVEDQAELDKRVATLKRKTGNDLKTGLQLLSAEILQFVAEREAGAPEMETAYFEGPQIYSIIEMMNQPLEPGHPSFAEVIEQVHRKFNMKPANFKTVTPNELDSIWLERNLPSIQYYYQTRILFGKRFGKRVKELVCGSEPKCGGADMNWCMCTEVAARTALANERLYAALKKWNATGVKPVNLDSLLKARHDAGDWLFTYDELTIKYNKMVRSTYADADAPVVRAIWFYPTNLNAMRALARQMDRIASSMP